MHNDNKKANCIQSNYQSYYYEKETTILQRKVQNYAYFEYSYLINGNVILYLKEFNRISKLSSL